MLSDSCFVSAAYLLPEQRQCRMADAAASTQFGLAIGDQGLVGFWPGPRFPWARLAARENTGPACHGH